MMNSNNAIVPLNVTHGGNVPSEEERNFVTKFLRAKPDRYTQKEALLIIKMALDVRKVNKEKIEFLGWDHELVKIKKAIGFGDFISWFKKTLKTSEGIKSILTKSGKEREFKNILSLRLEIDNIDFAREKVEALWSWVRIVIEIEENSSLEEKRIFSSDEGVYEQSRVIMNMMISMCMGIPVQRYSLDIILSFLSAISQKDAFEDKISRVLEKMMDTELKDAIKKTTVYRNTIARIKAGNFLSIIDLKKSISLEKKAEEAIKRGEEVFKKALSYYKNFSADTQGKKQKLLEKRFSKFHPETLVEIAEKKPFLINFFTGETLDRFVTEAILQNKKELLLYADAERVQEVKEEILKEMSYTSIIEAIYGKKDLPQLLKNILPSPQDEWKTFDKKREITNKSAKFIEDLFKDALSKTSPQKIVQILKKIKPEEVSLPEHILLTAVYCDDSLRKLAPEYLKIMTDEGSRQLFWRKLKSSTN